MNNEQKPNKGVPVVIEWELYSEIEKLTKDDRIKYPSIKNAVNKLLKDKLKEVNDEKVDN